MDLKKYNLDVLGVQETRLQEQEIDLGDHKLFHTDSWLSTPKVRQGGVGIAVTKRISSSIIEQVAVSERMAYVKFAAQRRANLVVIVCYAPRSEVDNLAKDNFWNQLSSLVSSFKQRERVCLVGDFNAEPGQQTAVNVPCRGPFGMGEENDNSEKFKLVAQKPRSQPKVCSANPSESLRFDEVLYAVRKLKNGKASGQDDISAGMLKSHNGITEWLRDIVNMCWTEENLPHDCKLAEVNYTKTKENDLSVGNIVEFHCSR